MPRTNVGRVLNNRRFQLSGLSFPKLHAANRSKLPTNSDEALRTLFSKARPTLLLGPVVPSASILASLGLFKHAGVRRNVALTSFGLEDRISSALSAASEGVKNYCGVLYTIFYAASLSADELLREPRFSSSSSRSSLGVKIVYGFKVDANLQILNPRLFSFAIARQTSGHSTEELADTIPRKHISISESSCDSNGLRSSFRLILRTQPSIESHARQQDGDALNAIRKVVDLSWQLLRPTLATRGLHPFFCAHCINYQSTLRLGKAIEMDPDRIPQQTNIAAFSLSHSNPNSQNTRLACSGIKIQNDPRRIALTTLKDLNRNPIGSMRANNFSTAPPNGLHFAHIALGSNMGNTIENIERACNKMSDSGIHVLKTSSLYHSKPMYFEDQDQFVNGVCKVNPRAKTF